MAIGVGEKITEITNQWKALHQRIVKLEKESGDMAIINPTAPQIEARKWAIQMAASLPENERNSMGGLLGAAKAIEEYALHIADQAGKE